jgi:hypothetical protein
MNGLIHDLTGNCACCLFCLDLFIGPSVNCTLFGFSVLQSSLRKHLR